MAWRNVFWSSGARRQRVARALPPVSEGGSGKRQVVARLVDEAAEEPEVEKLGDPVDPRSPSDFELGFREGRCTFIFCNLYSRPSSYRLVAHLHLSDATHVEAHGRVELQRVPPVVVSGEPKVTPIFCRSWLMNMSVVPTR